MSWSAAHDVVVWEQLGQCPRTASGGVSTAGGVGRIVSALAAQFCRTDGAIKAHINCHKCGRKGHFADKCTDT